MLRRGRLATLCLLGALQALALAGVHFDCDSSAAGDCHPDACFTGDACPTHCPAQHGPCELHQAQQTVRVQAPEALAAVAATPLAVGRPAGPCCRLAGPHGTPLPRPPDLGSPSSRAPPLP